MSFVSNHQKRQLYVLVEFNCEYIKMIRKMILLSRVDVNFLSRFIGHLDNRRYVGLIFF